MKAHYVYVLAVCILCGLSLRAETRSYFLLGYGVDALTFSSADKQTTIKNTLHRLDMEQGAVYSSHLKWFARASIAAGATSDVKGANFLRGGESIYPFPKKGEANLFLPVSINLGYDVLNAVDNHSLFINLGLISDTVGNSSLPIPVVMASYGALLGVDGRSRLGHGYHLLYHVEYAYSPKPYSLFQNAVDATNKSYDFDRVTLTHKPAHGFKTGFGIAYQLFTDIELFGMLTFELRHVGASDSKDVFIPDLNRHFVFSYPETKTHKTGLSVGFIF